MPSTQSKVYVFADADNGGVIHVANIKGGVGKSTVATNLAAALARRGPTLLVDLDVQGSATHAFGHDPVEFSSSAWDLFRGRFSLSPDRQGETLTNRWARWVGRIEQRLLPQIVGRGDLTRLCVPIQGSLDLVPAHADLFNTVHFFHLQNFFFNLDICRRYYKYIIIDTPSVWNRLTRRLFCCADLNLVPVTLNALSTRSLRDYLTNIRRLSKKHADVRVRIVKNEVFGRKSTKIKGKTRTMSENRRFLENLCEQVVIQGQKGVACLPQSMMFDLEIPESAIVRDAQDEGKSVHEFRQYSAVTRTFEELCRKVQYVLNMYTPKRVTPSWAGWFDFSHPGCKAGMAVVFFLVLMLQEPVRHINQPQPVAPQQLVTHTLGKIRHTFQEGESIYRMAKYAICKFRAKVPTTREINAYVLETIAIHNRTRQGEAPLIKVSDVIPAGLSVDFFPPSLIHNPREAQLAPVYAFFCSLVQDSAYVTGDWCERGTGGGTPHYGIDVAGSMGTPVIAPVDGIAHLRSSRSAGRTLGILHEGTVLFFSHLDKRFFNSGDFVKKGEVIGTIGMTGRTSGPHVHIGYGIRSMSGGLRFGGRLYKLTDPKLFFYRESFVRKISSEG